MPMKVLKMPKNRETTVRRDERGSVMLEFVLVLPIYLFLIGGTMLMYELFMAKLHLQEANRTLAWAVGDRYFAGRGNEEDFKAALYDAVCGYYARRNDIDNAIHKNQMTLWGFGKNRDLWGVGIVHKLKPDGTKFVGETGWGILTAGNMQLQMNRVSAAYIGALGAPSVLDRNHSENRAPDLYNVSYDLTRTTPVVDENDIEDEDFSPESYVYRRVRPTTENNRTGMTNDNKPVYLKNLYKIVMDSWPCDEDTFMETTEDISLQTETYVRQLGGYAQ